MPTETLADEMLRTLLAESGGRAVDVPMVEGFAAGEKNFIIENLVANHQAVHEQAEQLNKLTGATFDSPFFGAVWQAMDGYIEAVARGVGDTDEWIKWFIHENNCGKNGHEAGFGENMKPIRTVADLVELIEGRA